MNFENFYNSNKVILMEGALGERLKKEYNITLDDNIAMSNLIYNENSKTALKNIWKEYINTAQKYNLPFIATTPTRRANKERILKSCFDKSIIKDNVDFLKDIISSFPNYKENMFIGGLMGCKGDAYKADYILKEDEAKEFHSWQADLFKESKVDFLFAGIMPALKEAVGMAQAMEQTDLPYIISFMIRKTGRLIDGTSINDAITVIDKNVKRKPVCYMTNCVHPKILKEALLQPFNMTESVKKRFHGIQANTSFLSPEEIESGKEILCSDHNELADEIFKLKNIIDIKILGGCCGTDNTYMNEIAKRIQNEIN